MTEHEQHGGLEDLATMVLASQQDQPTQPSSNRDDAEDLTRRRKRRISGLIAAGIVVVLVAAYATLTLAAPVSAATVSAHGPAVARPGAASIVLPNQGEAAVSVVGASKYLPSTAATLLASEGGNAPLPMASISKVITALVVLNARPLGASGTGPIINFTRAETELYEKYFALNATIAPMPIGTSMSEYDALETMLVPSACNYAEALGDWAFGSEGAFIAATHTWLKAHDLNGTTMVEPTGLDARNTSTPTDLLAIGRLAMANPAIAKIVDKPNVDAIPSLSTFLNTNDLLGVDGVDGIKTGTLDSAGSDLLWSATENVANVPPLTITGVVLGGASRSSVDSDVKATITSILSGFQEVQLGSQGQVVGTYSTPWGSSASMVLARPATALVWSNAKISTTLAGADKTGMHSGDTVGTVTWVAGPTTVTVPVVLKGSITGPSAWWRLTHPFQLLGH